MNVQVSVSIFLAVYSFFSFVFLLCYKVIFLIISSAILAKKKCFQYKFYTSENQTSHSVAVDEHTKNYTEISKYLAMPHVENMKDVEQLHGFPAVKNLYKKFNAIMPFEADV